MSTSDQEGQGMDMNVGQHMGDEYRDIVKAEVSQALLLVIRIAAWLNVRLREQGTPTPVAAQATTIVGNQQPKRKKAGKKDEANDNNQKKTLHYGPCTKNEAPSQIPSKMCLTCGKAGHWLSECPEPKADGEGSPEEVDTRVKEIVWCGLCEQFGHGGKDCCIRTYYG
ncbi:hypothetical protein LXL04_037515 [Taraxacum kok-saghyz]